jgi:hypothetical protein
MYPQVWQGGIKSSGHQFIGDRLAKHRSGIPYKYQLPVFLYCISQLSLLCWWMTPISTVAILGFLIALLMQETNQYYQQHVDILLL